MSRPETIPATEVPSETVTVADIATADKIAGRGYSQAERELMVSSVTKARDQLKLLRGIEYGSVEPAIHFDPLLPGACVPRGKSRFRLSRGRIPRFSGDPESLAFL